MVTVFGELSDDVGGALGGGAVGVAPRRGAADEDINLHADLAGQRRVGVAAADLGGARRAVLLLVVIVGARAAERGRGGGGGCLVLQLPLLPLAARRRPWQWSWHREPSQPLRLKPPAHLPRGGQLIAEAGSTPPLPLRRSASALPSRGRVPAVIITSTASSSFLPLSPPCLPPRLIVRHLHRGRLRQRGELVGRALR